MPFVPLVTPENVRYLLGVDLTDEQVSDGVVWSPVYGGRAVLEVQRRDPAYADRTGDEQTRLNNAADHLTAAYLARKVPNLTGEHQGTAGGYTREAVDVDKLVGELLAVASAEIELVVGEEASAVPTFFALASGTRGL